ncbi:hypothetical protein LG293_16270 (plasmid) [Citricoccus nitrophenolicus]
MSKTTSGFLYCVAGMFVVASAGSALFDDSAITFLFLLGAAAFGGLAFTPRIEGWMRRLAGESRHLSASR